GVRTPFVKAFGPLAAVPAQELGRIATRAVLERAGLAPNQVDQVVFGNVALPPEAANIARVIALQAGIPQDRIAHTAQRTCASARGPPPPGGHRRRPGERPPAPAGGPGSRAQPPPPKKKEPPPLFPPPGRPKPGGRGLGPLLPSRPRHFKPV